MASRSPESDTTGTGGAGLADPEGLGPPRWDGARGRVEVWYLTFTTDAGTGYWLHYETVAPDGDGEPYSHGWVAAFPPDAPPIVSRFGPEPVATRGEVEDPWFTAGDVSLGPESTRGAAGDVTWDLTFAEPTVSDGPLYTFPRAVWHRELLPGAQIVPWPRIDVLGTFSVGDRSVPIEAVGALARIYGHGNAARWCWLHADMGDGTVLEIVSATSRRPGLRRLPMIAMLQLRVPGEADWPRRPLLSGPRLRTKATAAGFRVSGRLGRRRVRVDVTIPAHSSVALGYTDPDGATATCRNSERADATIQIERWRRGWRREHRWELAGTAHAEIGTRP